MTCGTYKLSVGEKFIFGSSEDFRMRRRRILADLGHGTFHHRGLQREYRRVGKDGVAFSPMDFMRRGAEESREAFVERLVAAEQGLLDAAMPLWGASNVSRVARGPDAEDLGRRRWCSPGFSLKMSLAMRSRAVV